MIRHLFLIILVLAGGIGASQIPGLVQAYQQRLGGALDETQRLVDAFSTQAQAEGLDYSGLAERHRESADAAVRGTADRMVALAERRGQLAAQIARLDAAGGTFAKIAIIAEDGDKDVMRATLANYQTTLTLDPVFGLVGVGIGWLVYGLLAWAFTRPRRRQGFRRA